MTHYQKLATMVFRIVGFIGIISGLFSWLAGFLFMPRAVDPVLILFATLPYLLGGAILFAASRRLAKWICFDFDKF